MTRRLGLRQGNASMAAGVRVVIQAGGRGERLRPLTLTTPKPLLHIDGAPMVERLVRQLADAGFRRFTVLTSWLGEQVEDFLRGLPGLPDDTEISFSHEEWGLGTIGGLARLGPWDGTMVFLFGDLVTRLDFGRLLEVHARSRAGVTLASHVETHKVRLGEIVAEGEEVVGYREKPEKEFLICSGIAAFEPFAVDLLEELPPPLGFGDLVNAAVAHGHRVVHWRHNALWFDVNDLGEMERASTALRATATSA